MDLLNGIGSWRGLDDSGASAEEDSGEIELSLDLSLGGCFGVDRKSKSLARSSSTAAGGGDVETEVEKVEACELVRACSLPVEEEWRKRKSVQTLRRMEAKRRRREKVAGRRGRGEEAGEATVEVDAASGAGVAGSEGAGLLSRGSGSVGSQGSCSADGGGAQGPEAFALEASASMARKTPSVHMIPSQPIGHAQVVTAPADCTPKKAEGTGCNTLLNQMPCVLTRGEGPNGRVIEGILCKYKKGEELKIVCVCHGLFLTAAEFVKHAGGGDVAYPMRHIIMKPSV